MESNIETYETPKVTDYGTLVEITAACADPGSGDFEFPNDPSKAVSFNNSRGVCTSTP